MSDNRALQLAARVQEMLRTQPFNSHAGRARVLTDEVHEREGIWYVPVSVLRDTQWMSLVYEAFSDIEEKLEAEGTRILIVPRIIPFVKAEDVA